MNYTILKNIRKFNKIILIFGILLICFSIQTKSIQAEENNVIKVGYPIVEGFTEIKDGVYSGYAYEYLREIAKYTGWEYEFVEMSLNDAMNELKNGNIDIVAGMLKNDQSITIYDFPEYDSGYTYTTLSILKDNENISQSNFETLNGLKVGYFETSKVRLNNFIKFCENNSITNIDLIPYPFQTGKELSEALESKEVDAIIDGDLLTNKNEKVVVKFGAIPYYFATTKGNTKITQQLNHVLFKIKESDPAFNQKLYNKYFQINKEHFFILTEEEQSYINNMAPLKAIYIDNYNPLQYYDINTKKPAGIFIDVMNLITQKSGLRFELVRVKSYEEAYELIKAKKADLIIGAPSIYPIADENEFTLTKSYLKFDMVEVVRKNKNNQQNNPKIIALPIGGAYYNINNDYEINLYDTFEECLTAVEKGIADLTCGNNHSVSNYLAAGYYPNLTVISNDFKTEVSIGLAKPTNNNLLSIINKAIYSLSEEEIKDIIYLNTINIKHSVTLKQFFFDNLALCIAVIILFLSLISIITYLLVRIKFKNLVLSKELLLKKSQTDPLTGLYNRDAFEQSVINYLNTKNPILYGAFIIIDIDYFKQINDSLGHKVGDDLLKDFSQLLKEFFSLEDILCRWGGDEFIVFMKDIEENNLQIVNQKLHQLCQLMNKDISYNGCSKKISLSIGSTVIKQNLDFNEIYQQADTLLYEVKRNGRNGFKVNINS
ncbi:MAG: diguanylate cyclase domain-containing protein [Clostridium neonatale]